MNVDKIQEHRYFVVKCEVFDEVEIKASAKAMKLTSFAVSSTSSIKVGLKKVKASPFKTVFVVDEAKNKAIFALTQNSAFEAEAKKKGGGDPLHHPLLPLNVREYVTSVSEQVRCVLWTQRAVGALQFQMLRVIYRNKRHSPQTITWSQYCKYSTDSGLSVIPKNSVCSDGEIGVPAGEFGRFFA